MTKALKPIALAILVSTAFALPAWADSPADEIAAANAAFAKSFNAGDAAAVATHYTEDASVLPPGGNRADGKAAIEAFWKGAIDGGLKNLTLKGVEVGSRDDLAYEDGVFTLDAPGSNGAMTTIKGKYIVVWKRGSDGAWRLYRDIWNADPAK